MFDNTTAQGRNSPLGQVIQNNQGLRIIPNQNTLDCPVPAGGSLPPHYEAHKDLKAVNYSQGID